MDSYPMPDTTNIPRHEARTYNNLQQLTNLVVSNPNNGSRLMDLSYTYPAGTNNGRISAEVNNLTTEQVSYTYDNLNRLGTALSVTGGSTNYGLSFAYDVYGNRTGQT